MSASAIRDLARRHAVGELSLEEYRARRHALIDDIVSGRQPLTYGELRPRTTASFRLRRVLMLSAVVVVVAVVAATSVWMLGSRTNPVSAAQQGTASQAGSPDTSPGPLLIKNFLSANNWSTDSIQDFIDQWTSLPHEERELARKDYRFPRLVSEVRQQIVSQRAMSGLTKNASNAKAQLAKLQDMATRLGIKPEN